MLTQFWHSCENLVLESKHHPFSLNWLNVLSNVQYSHEQNQCFAMKFPEISPVDMGEYDLGEIEQIV